MTSELQKPEAMDLRSLDISVDNRAKLKQLFPGVFTEIKDENGKLVESIDFDKLKAELGEFSDLFESRRERYGMDWPGKKDCMKIIQQTSIGTLKPCREESVNFDTTENLFIEGDNLEVLKLLQKSYYGKVKMIYIDPPYNTGKEFIYPDDYTESLETYLSYAGLVDDEGKKFSTNTPNEGRFHTKWLNMMYSRLYLAKNLLRDDGSIFISIDDNELSNLRKLCDEVYGEDNFIGVFSINTTPNARDYGHIGKMQEYCLFYAKNISFTTTYLIEDEEKSFKFKDAVGEFNIHPLYNSNEAFTNKNRPNLFYPFYLYPDKPLTRLGPNFYEIGLVNTINSIEIFPPLSQKNQVQFVWRWGKEKANQELNKEIVGYRNEDGEFRIVQKMRASEKLIRSIIEGRQYTSRRGTKELEEVFGDKIVSFPKPKELLKLLISAGASKNDIIIDFFAGSCTTAHATFELNLIDNGNRKWICVQLPEPTYELIDGKEVAKKDSEKAFKAGFKNVASIGKERIRRVIKKIEEEQVAEKNDRQMKLPGTDEEKPLLDLGFKVFKLDRSNFRVWDGRDPDIPLEKLEEQLALQVDHIDPEAGPEDILYELLLKAGFMPTEKVERLEMAGKAVYSIAEGALLICLEDAITRELIDAVAAAEPVQFICLDRGFKGNDQLKANAVQTFNARNQGREKEKQINFRTV